MFKAIQLSQGDDKKTIARLESLDENGLPPGDVTVRVEYSSLNFKDALAITGRGAIVRNWPLVPGIDLAGVVEESAAPEWRPGDRVVVNGWGLGEDHWGGLAQKARLLGGVAAAPAAGAVDAPGDGGRHRRLHRGAVRDGAAAAWHRGPTPGRSWSPALPAASARSRRRCFPGSATP